MNLEDQVCSLELAKKLKELGVKQISLFYWVNEKFIIYMDGNDGSTYKTCSAFTVAELGDMLPEYILPHENSGCKIGYYYLWCAKGIKDWEVSYIHGSHDLNVENIQNIEEPTEANARAKMLIYLIENKYMVIK